MRQDISFMKDNIRLVLFVIDLIGLFTKCVTVAKQSDAKNRPFEAVAGYKTILVMISSQL